MNLAESTNPRHRRALAESRLAAASWSGSLEDFSSAAEAVAKVPDTVKARNANFPQKLADVALKEGATRVVVDAANRTLDPEQTPRKKATWVGTEEKPYDFVHASRHSKGLSTAKSEGSSMSRAEVVDPETGEIVSVTPLTATDLEGDRQPHTIPTNQKGIDVIAVRQIPDQKRIALSGTVQNIQ